MNALRLASLLLAVSVVPAAAIELSLEENRAERGSVGYVDMQQLFQASPDARRAKDSFEDLVRQAEEQVNARKAELLRLHQDLDGLKVERESLAVSTPSAPTPAPVKPAPAPEPAKPVVPPASTVPPLAPVTAPAVPEPVAAAPLPAPEAPRPARPPMLSINLPGLATGPLMLEPAAPEPAKSPAPEMPQPPASVAEPAPLPQPPAPEPQPTPAPAPAAPAAPNLAQRLMELDGLIAGKNADIARAEVELAKERLGAEKSLTEVEGRKTDQVLARLYRAISEVAKREGVSVVVEKTTILYGHNAVDLTDKVLKHLRGNAPVPPQ